MRMQQRRRDCNKMMIYHALLCRWQRQQERMHAAEEG
jgi:hypothetical protein